MKNIFEPSVYKEIALRLDKLQPDSPRKWGKMNVAQMLAHCSAVLEIASGKSEIPRAPWYMQIIGSLIKRKLVDATPFKQGLPTAPSFVRKDEREFAKEKQRLAGLVKDFAQAGEAGVSKKPHPFFGKMSPMDWSISQYKHLDHHLRQFGV
jgi:hypothetical protein